MTTKIAVRKDDVLVVVDIQNDFCPGETRYRGDEVVPTINRLAGSFNM
jgi:nicotinamidase/pyrazinamidase